MLIDSTHYHHWHYHYLLAFNVLCYVRLEGGGFRSRRQPSDPSGCALGPGGNFYLFLVPGVKNLYANIYHSTFVFITSYLHQILNQLFINWNAKSVSFWLELIPRKTGCLVLTEMRAGIQNKHSFPAWKLNHIWNKLKICFMDYSFEEHNNVYSQLGICWSPLLCDKYSYVQYFGEEIFFPILKNIFFWDNSILFLGFFKTLKNDIAVFQPRLALVRCFL